MTATNRELDLGCGRNKHRGSIGVDRIPNPGVNLVADLDHFPYPLAANSFDRIYLTHVVEHLRSIPRLMEEVHRISRDGAEVVIVTPHYTDASSWQDPTHLWHLNSRSFDVFQEGADFDYYSTARFKVQQVEVKLLKLYRVLGLEFLLNLPNRYPIFRGLRRFWEQYLCFLIRAKYLVFHLQTLKGKTESR
jgi:SAM-dependent methyltransferase